MPTTHDTTSKYLPLCGNCEHFVVGGTCQLVSGQIKPKDICDLHEFGNPKPIGTETTPKYLKSNVNYKPGFFAETQLQNDNIIQNPLQMYNDLLQRGVRPQEARRAVTAYFSEPEPPYATPWPGPVTGLDLAGRIDPIIVPDTGVPLTNFNGLPQNVEPYPTPNKSPYGIGGEPYQNNPTPDPNSIGSTSQSYEFKNYPAPQSAVWNGLASDVNSEPSMHNEHGYNVSQSIPPWRYDIEDSQMNPINIPNITIPPSGTNPLAEATKKDSTRKNYLERMAKWAALLGGVAGMNSIIKKYLDSGTDKTLEVIAEYQYHGHDADDECAKFAGKRFNLLETHSRPVIPNEKLGYTTTHPNCICTWKVMNNFTTPVDAVTKPQQDDINRIEEHITQAAKDDKLHKIKKDGKLSKNTTKKNPLKELCSCMNVTLPSIHLDLPLRHIRKKTLQEAITDLRSEFEWLTSDYLHSAKSLAGEAGGELYLIRAAGETITDHTGEGEKYRRKLSAEELNSMTRTAIGKSMDINHQPEFQTDATILDAEFDKNRKEIQMLVIERDPQINQAISNGKITAVSINGGMPRSEKIEPCTNGCTDGNCELCLVPQGVVLGELDGIAMTWVVTDKNGLYWNGHFVPSAEPGIKFTIIESL